MLDRNKKIIFLDLDGTIIDHQSNEISKRTIQAIHTAQENGHLIAIATGRAPVLLDDIPHKLGVDAIITTNGRHVEFAGEVIFEDTIPKETVIDFVNETKKLKKDVAFLSKSGFVSPYIMTEVPKLFSKTFNMQEPTIIPDFHLHNSVMQLVLFSEHPRITDDYLNTLQRRFPQLEFNISCEYGLDVNKTGGMKELGVKKLIDHLGIPLSETIAIGDGFNDVTMIKSAGIGVAMGNACQPLKEAADFVTDTVSEDGVYKAFEKLGLI